MDVEVEEHQLAWTAHFLIRQTLDLEISRRIPTKDQGSIVEGQVVLDLSCIYVVLEYLPLKSHP